MFFCKELLITEIDMLLLQYVVGENLIDDCIFVSNRNMPSFLKVGSLKLHFGTLKCKLLLLDDDDSLDELSFFNLVYNLSFFSSHTHLFFISSTWHKSLKLLQNLR